MNEKELEHVSHKYRDEPACCLSFQPSIERLTDTRHCRVLDEIIHKPGLRWERNIAVSALGESLPSARGLYMFAWRPDLAFRFAAPPEIERLTWVLYVGKAGTEEGANDTIKSRYVNEYSKYVGKDPSCLWEGSSPSGREQLLARFLTLRPLEYWFLSVEKVRDIELLERKLIRFLRPPLNTQHAGPKLRPGLTTPAFEEPK